MKKFKLGNTKELTLYEIKKALETEEEFKKINNWNFDKINLGEMHHTYVITNGKKKYFVKEVKIHEAQVNYYLSLLKLKHLIYTNFPKLLDKKILVIPYIKGSALKKRKISIGLLKDFINFQDELNIKKFVQINNKYKLNNISIKNKKFYKKRVLNELEIGRRYLIRLKKYKLPIIDKYIEIADILIKNKKIIAKEFSMMPYCRLHHDFKELNIIKNIDGDKLIDWGSSYGYGPFLYDLAPFLIDDDKSFKILMKNSNIARKYPEKIVRKWLFVALADRFNDFTYWTLRPDGPNTISKEKLKKELLYNYKTYKVLNNINKYLN